MSNAIGILSANMIIFVIMWASLKIKLFLISKKPMFSKTRLLALARLCRNISLKKCPLYYIVYALTQCLSVLGNRKSCNSF